METYAPEIDVTATVGQVVVSSPAPTPTLSPAGPPPAGTWFYTAVSSPLPFVETKDDYFDYQEGIFKKAVKIYGYGPSMAKVYLNGIGISEHTVSNDIGYFSFPKIYAKGHKFPELCIQAVDSNDLTTQPSCIPATQPGSFVPEYIGPVYLSPTVFIEKNNPVTGESISGRGSVIPGAKVFLNVSKDESSKISLVKPVFAYKIPSFEIVPDEKGNFEFSLPTQASSDYRIFVFSKIGDVDSAKSNTLKFSVVNPVFSVWRRIWEFLLQSKISFVIFCQVVTVIFLSLILLESPRERLR